MGKQDLLVITSYILPLIIAITLHEAGHAFAAYRLGDPTAKSQGRLSLDPLKHIDPFGTILLPGILLLIHSPVKFGWAKPVPIDFRNLRHPRRDVFLVAIAGPAMNFVLAFISALLIYLGEVIPPEQAPWMFMNFYNSVTVNVVLGVFNLLPILPLDGGRVLNALLPRRLARPRPHRTEWADCHHAAVYYLWFSAHSLRAVSYRRACGICPRRYFSPYRDREYGERIRFESAWNCDNLGLLERIISHGLRHV